GAGRRIPRASSAAGAAVSARRNSAVAAIRNKMMDALRDSLSNYISWIKAFHVIAVIAWMSGMLYLPRLFVYHSETTPGYESSDRFKVMETRLLKGITNPSMVAVWILGPTLAWLTGTY